jgi:hypothetical protein
MKSDRIRNTNLIFSNSLNISLLISILLFLSFANENLPVVKALKINSFANIMEGNYTSHNRSFVINNATRLISIHKKNEKTKMQLNFPSQNMTIIPAQITDKVDMDIKKLDIKLEKLSKMIESYEKIGNANKTKDSFFNIKKEEGITKKLCTDGDKNTTEEIKPALRRDTNAVFLKYFKFRLL